MSEVQDTESKIIRFKIGSLVRLIIYIISVVFIFGGIVARGEYNRANLEEKQACNKIEITQIKTDVNLVQENIDTVEKNLITHKNRNDLEMQEYRINQGYILEILIELKQDIKEIKKGR